MFYFLHIPRTSGESITEEISISLDDEQRKDFLAGHLACLPFKNSPYSVFTEGEYRFRKKKIIEFSFSLIREPLERLISAHSYVCFGKNDIEGMRNKEYFLQTVRGQVQTSRPFPGFDGKPNMQCAYLYSEMIFPEDGGLKGDSSSSALRDLSPHPKSLEDVLNSITLNNINVYTMENRAKCVSDVNGYIYHKYGRKINGEVFKNRSASVGFTLNKAETDEIRDLNSLDYKLYEHFLSHEK
jgi:hypothetical protein